MEKKISFVLMALFSLLVLNACRVEKPDKITLADTTNGSPLSVDGDGERLSISFTTNKDWTATSNQSWCVVSPTSGISGSANIQVSVSRNEETQQRTANITLTAGTASASITVIQEKGNLKSEAGTEDMDHKEW
jgi:hypothetical protein